MTLKPALRTLLWGCLLSSAAPAVAQHPPLRSHDPPSITLRHGGQLERVSLSEAWSVKQTPEHRGQSGLALGALAGAVVGAVVAKATFEDQSGFVQGNNCDFTFGTLGCTDTDTRLESDSAFPRVMIGAAIGAVGGSLLGWLIGSRFEVHTPVEFWPGRP